MADDKAVLAQYANFFRVGYNATEFVLDFCQAYESGEEPATVCRMVITPAAARELKAVLEHSLEEFAITLGADAQEKH